MGQLKVICKYVVAGSADGSVKLYYTVEVEAATFDLALEYLGNIARTCQGVITHTSIDKIENNGSEIAQ